MDESENAGVAADNAVPTPPAFDYNQLRDDTAGKCIGDIYKIMAGNADLLVAASALNATEETITEAYSKISQEVMTAIVADNVIDADMQFLFDKTLDHLQLIFTTISKQKNSFDKELLGYVIGARNPGPTAEIARGFATMGDLMTALGAKRRENGIGAE